MSEIADLLQQKAGLSPDKAQEVEQLIVPHVIARVAQFQGIVGSMLGLGQNAAGEQPEAAESGRLSGLLGAASGLFGGGNKG
jgi:hypothetical protein